MPSLQLPELLVLGFLFIVFFGRGKLGSTFQELGGAINQFKKGMNEAEAIKADINSSVVEASKVESKPVEVKLQAVAE